ncbi:MAG: hypothetical protein I8H75_03810 [Myxococcaceae bacterium]|nr:hypothetical protein [Myxococcaceae bacterium]MBH2006453.1 hypothetical protein [Myxococcaceae bacterium]
MLRDRYVNQAFETMERANWTPEEYDAYIRACLLLEAEELTAKEQFDLGFSEGEVRGEARGEARGKEIGKAIGQVKAIEETARKLLILGIDRESILKATGLSLEALAQLNQK